MRNIFLSFFVFLFMVTPVFSAQEYGTFVKVVEKASGSFDEVSMAVESGLTKAGWAILNTFDSGVQPGCKFRSRVIVFSSDAYAYALMKNGVKAAFAVALRAGVYEDETGVHVTVVNPASINRTVIHETKLDSFSIGVSNSLVQAISAAVPGNPVKKQTGQLRDTGRIGGMGGGDFLDKIEEVYAAADDSDATFNKVVEGVKKGILGNKKNWKLVYTYGLSPLGPVIFGVTESNMEARAFEIAGDKRASSNLKFPGIDHGAAFPIEVIVYKDGGKVKVVTMDEMYRMKLYFEDAGMWAFMKNMKMPGDIESEVVEMSISQLDK